MLWNEVTVHTVQTECEWPDLLLQFSWKFHLFLKKGIILGFQQKFITTLSYSWVKIEKKKQQQKNNRNPQPLNLVRTQIQKISVKM